jgi:hypothetical protein
VRLGVLLFEMIGNLAGADQCQQLMRPEFSMYGTTSDPRP